MSNLSVSTIDYRTRIWSAMDRLRERGVPNKDRALPREAGLNRAEITEVELKKHVDTYWQDRFSRAVAEIKSSGSPPSLNKIAKHLGVARQTIKRHAALLPPDLEVVSNLQPGQTALKTSQHPVKNQAGRNKRPERKETVRVGLKRLSWQNPEQRAKLELILTTISPEEQQRYREVVANQEKKLISLPPDLRATFVELLNIIESVGLEVASYNGTLATAYEWRQRIKTACSKALKLELQRPLMVKDILTQGQIVAATYTVRAKLDPGLRKIVKETQKNSLKEKLAFGIAQARSGLKAEELTPFAETARHAGIGECRLRNICSNRTDLLPAGTRFNTASKVSSQVKKRITKKLHTCLAKVKAGKIPPPLSLKALARDIEEDYRSIEKFAASLAKEILAHGDKVTCRDSQTLARQTNRLELIVRAATAYLAAHPEEDDIPATAIQAATKLTASTIRDDLNRHKTKLEEAGLIIVPAAMTGKKMELYFMSRLAKLLNSISRREKTWPKTMQELGCQLGARINANKLRRWQSDSVKVKQAIEEFLVFSQSAHRIEEIIARNGIVTYKARLLAAEIESLKDPKQLVLFCNYLAVISAREVLLVALIARELIKQNEAHPEKMAQARQWAKAQKKLIHPKVNLWLTKPQPQQEPTSTKAKPAKKKPPKSAKTNTHKPATVSPMAIYQGQLARYPLLPEAEVINLAKAGTPGAKRRLVEHNLRLVINVVKKYYYPGCGLAFSDLVQEGNIGLMRAADKFEWYRDCKFSTYAVWWIRQRVLRAFSNQGKTIRLPVHIEHDIQVVNRTSRDFETKFGHPPHRKRIS